jgi:ribonuclease HI
VVFPEHLAIADEQIVDFGCSESSNNRMEQFACIKSVEWVRKNGPWPGVNRVLVITDSLYVVDNLSRAPYWKKQRWRNFDGKPIENSDLWNQLIAIKAKAGIRIDFVQLKGKRDEIRKCVDKAAKAAAKRGGTRKDIGFRVGKLFRSHVKGVARPFPAKDQTAVIFPYRKNAPIKGENTIRFDVYDETSKTYPAKYLAYTTNALTFELHRGHWFRVRFNSSPRNPRIEEIVEEVFPSREGISTQKRRGVKK